MIFATGSAIELDLSVIDWVAIGSIAALVTMLINVGLVVSIMIGVRSIREAQKTRNANLFVWMIEQIEEIKPDSLILASAQGHHRDWSDEESSAATRVANRFQRLAYASRAGLIDSDHLKEMFGMDFVKSWRKLKPMIVEMRLKAGEPPTAKDGAFIRKDFELVADSFVDFYKRIRPLEQEPMKTVKAARS